MIQLPVISRVSSFPNSMVRRGSREGCRRYRLLGGLLLEPGDEVVSILRECKSVSLSARRRKYTLPFFKPPKAILVPGMYFLGFSRYSNYLQSVDVDESLGQRPIPVCSLPM